jgi:hypothetical protein
MWRCHVPCTENDDIFRAHANRCRQKKDFGDDKLLIIDMILTETSHTKSLFQEYERIMQRDVWEDE